MQNEVIPITARGTPLMVLWNRIVVFLSCFSIQGALPRDCKMFSSQGFHRNRQSLRFLEWLKISSLPKAGRLQASQPRFRWRSYGTDAQYPRPRRIEF